MDLLILCNKGHISVLWDCGQKYMALIKGYSIKDCLEIHRLSRPYKIKIPKDSHNCHRVGSAVNSKFCSYRDVTVSFALTGYPVSSSGL